MVTYVQFPWLATVTIWYMFFDVGTSFWDFGRLCGIQREETFFTAKWPGSILDMLLELMSKVASISQYVATPSWIINLCKESIFSDTHTDCKSK